MSLRSGSSTTSTVAVGGETLPNGQFGRVGERSQDMTTDGNRMIDRKYRIVRERVKMGEILPVWIDGKTNPTDVGTKAQANVF